MRRITLVGQDTDPSPVGFHKARLLYGSTLEDRQPKMLEKLSKDRSEVSASAQIMLRDYAGSRWPTMNHKGRIGRLASVLGFTPRRVRSLYQNEPGARIRADELAAIAALRREHERGQECQSQPSPNIGLWRRALLRWRRFLPPGDEEHGRPYLDGLRAVALGNGGAPIGGGREDGPRITAQRETDQ